MHVDIVDLRQFYYTMLGRVAEQSIALALSSVWARLPQERPSQVRITTTDGRVWQAEVGVNRGDDASPYTPQELRAKFIELCTRVWPTAHAEQVLHTTLSLAQGHGALDDWLQLLRRPPVR